MYFRLALNNIKKSFKDYTIYFLTLTLSVCIFYVFNAIESQKAMMTVSETTHLMMQNLVTLIGQLSFFIAVVLALLILYANKFLIRRRKKELGLYMLLGMEKSKISLVLVLETFMIGLCSLITGLTLGIFLSQGLSVFTAKLFGAEMTQFKFVFSENGFLKSMSCFAIIYMVVMLFNVRMLSKCKLIDLLEGSKKNEVPKVKSLRISVVLFMLSIMSLVISYIFIIDNGLLVLDKYFYMAFIFAFIGTFLFFMSLSGFLLKLMQSCKKLYFSQMNMFIFRQINSKINTTYVSMTFICLMLAVTIVSFSSGIAMNQSMNDELVKLTPYDASFIWEKHERRPNEHNVDIMERLEVMGLDIEDYAKDYVTYKIYESPLTMDIFYGDVDISKSSYAVQEVASRKVGVIKLSDYNKILKLQGKKPISLEANQYAIQCGYGEMLPLIKNYLKYNKSLNYKGYVLEHKGKEILEDTLYVAVMSEPKINIILSDEIVDETEVAMSIVNLNYKEDSRVGFLIEEKLMEDIEKTSKQFEELGRKEEVNIAGLTRNLVYDTSVGLSAIMTYLTVYISIVFLITSAAVLALQQLTEAEDNKARYRLLAKLGVDEKLIHRTLFSQIAIYFIMPLTLAIIHGVVGIQVANSIIKVFGEINILASIMGTALIFIIIYGAYFLGTYISSKNIIE